MESKDPEEMEMPCMCDCGEWFDLHEGNGSLHSKKVICDKCSEAEHAEQEREEEIENEMSKLNDAIVDIQDARKRLIELKHPEALIPDLISRSRVIAELEGMKITNPPYPLKARFEVEGRILDKAIERIEKLK